jgi:hypothetical protein
MLSDPLPKEFVDPYSAPHCSVHGNARAIHFFLRDFAEFRPSARKPWIRPGKIRMPTAPGVPFHSAMNSVAS